MAEKYAGGGRTVAVRLGMCNDLLNFRKKIDAASEAQKINVTVMAGRRIKAIRGVLLGRAGISLADEMLVPGEAAARLMAALESVKDSPSHIKVSTAAYVKGIMQTISVIQNAEVRVGASDPVRGVWNDLAMALSGLLPDGGANNRALATPVIDNCLSVGKWGQEAADALAKAATGGNDADIQIDGFIRMKAAAFDKVEAQRVELSKKIDDLRFKAQAAYLETGFDSGGKDIQAFSEAYYKFLDEVYTPVLDAKNEVAQAARKKAQSDMAQAGSKIIASVMDKSSITPDDATRWANAQEVTPQAVNRLKGLKYPLPQFRADMAEFYRFTGGRVTSVRVHSQGDRRANATDIEAHGKVGTINLATSFNKRVLWHELAHHMEADPVAKMAAGQFIRRRSVDGKTHSLRSLTGNTGYRPNEIALKGDFFSPYIGKIYADGVTEVFSMGIESFSDPEMLARRAIQDPKTLEFVAGFVKAPVDPLAKAHMALREIVTAMQGDVTQATAGLVNNKIEMLSGSVELTPDTDTTWQQGDWRLSKWTQLGRFEESGYYLLTGKVRGLTKRLCNGLVLARREGSGWLSTTEMPGTDQSTVKAMYALYRKNGVMPNYYSMNNADYIQRQSL